MKLKTIRARYFPPALILEFLDPSSTETKLREINLTPHLSSQTAATTKPTAEHVANLIIKQERVNPTRYTHIHALLSRMFDKLNSYTDLTPHQYNLTHTVSTHSMPMTNCCFNKAGDKFLTGSYDRTCKVFSSETGAELAKLSGHMNVVYAVAFNNPFGDKIITGSFDRTAKLWSLETGKCFHTFRGHSGEIVCLAFDPSSSIVATGGMDNQCILWDVRSGNEIFRLRGHSAEVIGLEFSNTGDKLVTGSFDSTINLWDIRAGKNMHTYIGHRGEVTAVRFNFPGTHVLSGSMDGTAKLWDASSGKLVNTFTGHSEEVLDVAMDLAGTRVVTASTDCTARVYALDDLSNCSGERIECVHELKGHVNEVSKVVFNSHGDRIMTASRDKTAKMWSATTGACLQTLEGHTDDVFSCAFSYLDDMAMTGGKDNSLKTSRVSMVAANSKNAADAVWLRVVILAAISVLSVSTRLFSVIRFESVIHEFDPWFNYRSTMHLVEKGFYEFLNWFDELSWYPLGRVVGGTVYPGIIVTAGAAHWIMNALNFPVDIRNVCVFLAPFFSAFTAVACYLLTTEIKDASAGLLAAAFIGIAPGYISRSVAGSYDNEGIAIFLLMITFYFWLKAQKVGSVFYAGIAALFYFYMVASWGGYVFIINLIPLHVFTLLLMGRFTPRLYVSYSTFYVIGTLASMQIPFVGFQPTRTSEHMAALGIFGLLQIVAFIEMLRSHLSSNEFKSLFQGLIIGIFMTGFAALVALTVGGYIAPWTGRFYSLWDTGYAKKYIPIIASVSEHQPTAWPAFFFDLQLLMPLFPAGIYFCFQELRDEHVFIILYAATGSYFAGVMVRLMLTLTPCVCIASAFAVSKVLDLYLSPTKEIPNDEEEDEPAAAPAPKGPTAKAAAVEKSKRERKPTLSYGIKEFDTRIIVVAPIAICLILFAWHCTWVTSTAYSSPSIVLASQNQDGTQHIIDDFREAYYWLRMNSEPDDKILSWWDYGYQITGMANRTVLVDNNTWNNTHIATVGKAMSCSEDVSYEIMKRHDVKFVLVIFGAVLGYSGDDINKFLWMVRIGEGVYPNDVNERSFFTERGEYKVDDQATVTMRNSVMYKTSYYRFAEMFGGQAAYDRVRGQQIPKKPIVLHTMDEAFSSENMIVRIYKVKDLDNLGRSLNAASSFGKSKRKKRTSAKPVKARKRNDDDDE
ncbi:oligosaccharyl transferase stt3 subunit [Chytriomyces hyalinus]|nr:oligosaccharyl transferase stt3 subunit [Chytriomyces hyalinus]